jgi:hypothetical protein
MKWLFIIKKCECGKFGVFCFFLFLVLFVCLQVSVFVVCFSMERHKCIGFGDGVGPLLRRGWSLWGCESCL